MRVLTCWRVEGASSPPMFEQGAIQKEQGVGLASAEAGRAADPLLHFVSVPIGC